MTDKPIHEMQLADYQRALANMERKRYGTDRLAMDVVNKSGSPLEVAEKTIDGRTMIRMMIRDDLKADIAKNGPIKQPIKKFLVGEQGPEMVRFGKNMKFDGPA